ncbi:MAG: amidohydrolase family protein [Desulfobacterales bacterium]|jgi:predicted TIM-barrel fold metal-dependent hydrolase
MKIVDMRVRIPRGFEDNSPDAFMLYYQDRAGFNLRYEADIDVMLKEMNKASIEKAVLHSEWEFEDPIPLNKDVTRLVQEFPDRFFGAVSVDPRKGITASAKEFRNAAEATKCVGLSLQPAFLDMLPNDRRLYVLYQLCEAHNIPLWLHTGINYAPNHSMEADRPIHLEKILLDFPDIKLVACHSGWPWVGELCAIARKFYPRVFLEIGGIAPKYIFAQGTGWDPFLQYANSLLQDQVLFGTDWPTISFERAKKEINEAPLKDEVKSKILYENGMRLIKETLN